MLLLVPKKVMPFIFYSTHRRGCIVY
ncbi:hypothetical protein ACFX13_017482 [Malus domestica]